MWSINPEFLPHARLGGNLPPVRPQLADKEERNFEMGGPLKKDLPLSPSNPEWPAYAPMDSGEIAPQVRAKRNATLARIESFAQWYYLKTWIDWDVLLKEAIGELPLELKKQSWIWAPEAINLYLSLAESPHSMILPNLEHDQELKSEEKFFGIGASLYQTESGVRVRKIRKSGPLFGSALRPGDQILKIATDSESSDLLHTIPEVLNWTKAPSSRNLKITTLASNSENVTSILTQEIISTPLEFDFLQTRNGKIAYIKYDYFDEEGCKNLRTELDKLENKKPRGLILDLRGDFGGRVSTAICMAAVLLGTSENTYEKSKLSLGKHKHLFNSQISDLIHNPELQDPPYNIHPPKWTGTTPLIVLVNASTASSAEYLAAVLQDLDRAYLLGERTFGKAITLEPRALTDSIVQIVTEHILLRPSGTSAQEIGVSPDFWVNEDGSWDLVKDNVREEDLVLFPLKLPNTVAWKNPRALENEKHQGCLKEKSQSVHMVESDFALFVEDPQLNAAVAAIECLEKH